MPGAAWTEDELKIILQYERTAKSAYTLYHEIIRNGHARTYTAVRRKIENMGLHKPERYVTGHEHSIGYFDIETTDLKADIGIILSWAIKERDKGIVKSACITKEEIVNGDFDRRVVAEMVDAMKEYDTLVTYYGTRFDIPYARTRALEYKFAFPTYRELSHKDLYYQVRRALQLHRNSLKAATKYFGIAGKTDIDISVWRKARYGDEKALQYVFKHNIADVRILERLHKKIELYCPPSVQPA